MRRIWKCVFRIGAGALRTEQTQTSPLPWSHTRNKCIYLPTVNPVCLYSSMPPAPGVEAGSPEKRQKLEKMEVEQQEELVLRFAKLSSDAYEPVRGSEHAAGYDLFSNKDMVVLAKNKALVPTDIQIALPEGCYGRVAPRSGLASKKFIDVGAGVIDRDYRGNVFVLLFNFSDDDFQVKRGDRIAQLICERICTPKLLECTTLDETKRGEGGFGSTGTN